MSSASVLDSAEKEVTVCEFPGLASLDLPFIHHGFPPNLRRRFGRCRQSPTKDLGVHPDITLPPLPNSNGACAKRKITNQYVSNNKACWKLKGINPTQVFSINRNKSGNTNHDDGVAGVKVSLPAANKYRSFIDDDVLTFAVDSVARAMSRDPQSHNASSEEEEADDLTKALTDRLDEYDVELGVRQKKPVNGRKLGNVLSTKRMKQILRNEERILPYIFYKTTISEL